MSYSVVTVGFRGFRDPGLNVSFDQDALCFVGNAAIFRSEHLFLYKQVHTGCWAISTPTSERSATSRYDMLLDAQNAGEHGFAVEASPGVRSEFTDGAWSVSPLVCFAVGGAPGSTHWYQRRGLTKVLDDYIRSRVLAPRISRTGAPPLPPPLGGVLPLLGPPPVPRPRGVIAATPPRRLALRPQSLRYPYAEPAEPIDPSLQESRPRSSTNARSSRDVAVVEEGVIPEDSPE
jgi:hypothetical protein